MVSDDGKTAAFNSDEGKAVLENLKKMRWDDNSMGRSSCSSGRT